MNSWKGHGALNCCGRLGVMESRILKIIFTVLYINYQMLKFFLFTSVVLQLHVLNYKKHVIRFFKETMLFKIVLDYV